MHITIDIINIDRCKRRVLFLINLPKVTWRTFQCFKVNALYTFQRKNTKETLTLLGFSHHKFTRCSELMRFFTIPLAIIPKPRKPNLSDEGWIFLAFSSSETLLTSTGGVSWNKIRVRATGGALRYSHLPDVLKHRVYSE